MSAARTTATSSWPVKGAVVVFVLGCGVGLLYADRPTIQPYPFNHAVHTAKADCTLCHQGARTRAHAGLPSFAACAGCHTTAPGRSPTAREEARWSAIRKAAGTGHSPSWNRLYRVPGHVYFSHRRHVTLGGISCAQCHGDMAHATKPPGFAAKSTSMRTCITCHERERVTVDCSACHR